MEVVGAGRDVVAAALDAASDLDRTLFQQCPQPMWLFDDEAQRIVDVNTAALALYGYARDEFLALSAGALEDPTAAGAGPSLGSLVDGLATRHRRKDTSTFTAELSSRQVLLGGCWLRLTVVNDVTRRLEAERQLRESERRFRDVLETVQMLSVVLDVEGRVSFINEHGAKLLGWPREELIGKDWFVVCLPADEAGEQREGFVARLPRGGIRRTDENSVLTRDGARRVIAWNNTVLRDGRGEVSGTASIGMDVTDQRQLERQLWSEANHDAVTGLANRRLFFRQVGEALERARASEDYQYAVVLLNVDRFKNVNESLGPGVGDQLLAAFGRMLLGRVRPNDTVARLSADEFALLLDGIGGHEQAAAVAQSIHDALATPFQLEGHEVYATTSMGIGMRARTHESPEDVLRDAHTALNRAKALGKARHEFFKATMRAGAVARMRMENDLRRAMARHELRLAYQPIVVMEDGRLAGFEALIRWDSKERGLVSPVEFIPIAEETGLIVPIGEYVLREACSQIAAWAAEHPDLSDLVVNVNVSGRQLGPALIAQVDQAILDAGIKPGNLKLEITESVLMENAAAAGDLLRRIKARGVRICIDDFGTGYSSLSQLVRLPVDTMKIDRMFVAQMSKDKDTAEIVRSIVALATSLKLDVVAEGVETEEQRRALAKLGCTYGQGYLFARPLDGPAVLGMLAPMSRRR